MHGLQEPRADGVGLIEDALESQGVFLLGSPIVATHEFVVSKLDSTILSVIEYEAQLHEYLSRDKGKLGLEAELAL